MNCFEVWYDTYYTVAKIKFFNLFTVIYLFNNKLADIPSVLFVYTAINRVKGILNALFST